jgi:two-component system response regulator RegA
MNGKRLLLLEDDRRFRKTLAEDFVERGYAVTEAGNLRELKTMDFDYAVIDLRLLGESGLDAIPQLKKQSPDCQIVVLSGYGSVATAVAAVKLGALNYLHKPASCELIEAALKDDLKEEGLLPFQIAPLNQHEHEYIEFVLSQNKGNITKTAQQLGLHRQSLQRKLKKLP